MILRSELLRLVYELYPAGMPIEHPEHQEAEEHQRRVEAQRVATGDEAKAKWKDMLRRLDASFHTLAGGWPDAGLSAFVELRRARLGFHVSILGPYFGVHRIGSADEARAAEVIAHEIDDTYGFESIPPEVGYGRVPHVELHGVRMGEATLYECLLSPDWRHSSHDEDDPLPENLRDTKMLRPPAAVMLTGMTKASRQAFVERLMSLDLPGE